MRGDKLQRIIIYNPHEPMPEEFATLRMCRTHPSGFLFYNAFDDEVKDFVREAKIRELPYIIDKEIELVTPAPLYVGSITLQFACKDYQGNAITEDTVFQITIGDKNERIIGSGGLFEIKLERLTPELIPIKILGDGYWPFIDEIKIETVEKEITIPNDPEMLKLLPAGLDTRKLVALSKEGQ